MIEGGARDEQARRGLRALRAVNKLDARAGLPPPRGLGWTDRIRAPDDVDEGLDEFGNRVTGKWMPKGIDQELWERIRGATIEGYLGFVA